MDSDYNIITQKKWSSVEKTFEKRFPEFATNFHQDLSKIIVNPEKEKALVAIEQAIFIQNPKSTIAIANVVGAVWGFLLKEDISTTIIDNRRWKKIIIGKGNAKKDDIKAFAEEKWGDKFPEQDYADAACIALWNKRRF